MSTINLRPRPEENELRLKLLELADFEKELVEKELQLTGLRAELAAFERQYMGTVGVLYAELDEIAARIAELIAHRNPSNAQAQAIRRPCRRWTTFRRVQRSDRLPTRRRSWPSRWRPTPLALWS